ncbi:hypothetical protein EK904_004497 [Melospiza melodia maxima]|nr:hypothetical protein EK904_004497 [Melospiza melodia maxima]
MNREGVPGKSPEEMYIQQKVRVLLMLRKMGSNVLALASAPLGKLSAMGVGREQGHTELRLQCPAVQAFDLQLILAR